MNTERSGKGYMEFEGIKGGIGTDSGWAARLAVSGDLLGGLLRSLLKMSPGSSLGDGRLKIYQSIDGADMERSNAAPRHDCAKRIVGSGGEEFGEERFDGSPAA